MENNVSVINNNNASTVNAVLNNNNNRGLNNTNNSIQNEYMSRVFMSKKGNPKAFNLNQPNTGHFRMNNFNESASVSTNPKNPNSEQALSRNGASSSLLATALLANKSSKNGKNNKNKGKSRKNRKNRKTRKTNRR